MKPLLTRIEEELAVCTDPLRRAELLGEKGCYLARVGDIDLSIDTVRALRSDFGTISTPASLVWAMMVEGLIQYFSSLSTTAVDRVQRSCECSRALGLTALRETSAAWWAHLEFERSNFTEVARLLKLIDPESSGCSASAKVRLAMVLGDAFLFSGDRASSRKWYLVAHRCSVDIGDQAAIGALMYNRASFGVSRLRVEDAIDESPIDLGLLKHSAMELASARVFEGAVGIRALGHLVDVAEGRILILEGNFDGAARVLRPLHPVVETREERPNRSHVAGDLMYCEFKLHRLDIAAKMAIELLSGKHETVDPDDRVVLFRQLMRVFVGLGDAKRLESAQRLFSSSLQDYRDSVEKARLSLQGFRTTD